MRRQPWSEHGDETHQRTDAEDARAERQARADHAYALERLAKGPVPWVSLPDGLARRLIDEGHAVQDGIAYLVAPCSPGMSPGQTAEGIESEGKPNAEDADTNAVGKDDTVAPASRGTATPDRIFFVTVGGTSTDAKRIPRPGDIDYEPYTVEEALNVAAGLAEEGIYLDADGYAHEIDEEEEGVFAELRRMGEESRAEPLSPDDEAMLERVKAAVHAATAHDWTFDPHHMAQRCLQCGMVDYDAAPPIGPCAAHPSKWVPYGAAEPDPVHVDDMCTHEGPDVDPETGCLELAVRVVGAGWLCPYHAAYAEMGPPLDAEVEDDEIDVLFPMNNDVVPGSTADVLAHRLMERDGITLDEARKMVVAEIDAVLGFAEDDEVQP